MIGRVPLTAWKVDLLPGERRVLWVAAFLLAFATADVMTGGPLSHLDGGIRAAVQPRPPTTPWWLALPEALGDLGVGAPLLAIAALICAQALWRLWPLVMSLAIFAVSEGAVLLMKSVVARPGPGEWATRPGYPGYFPSGHTTTAAVVTGTVAYLALVGWYGGRSPAAAARALLAGLATGALAAVAAVLGDFHWASDGIGGLALSTVVMVIGFAAARNHVEAGPAGSVRPTERRPRPRPQR